jgi:type VI secretion system protein ImpJ
MTAPQRVVWSEGMLMSAQHFQQQDFYHEAHVHERLAAVVAYGWGVYELELDDLAVEAGQVSLRSFVGVLPGGTTLRLRHGDADAPAMRAIEPTHFPAQRETLDVYLALSVGRGVGTYARSEAERGAARYVVESRRTLDVLAPDQEETIDFARPNPVLLFGDEAREDYESIKIAEVVRDRAGQLRFAGSYVPPCLRLGASPALVEGVRSVLATTVAKRRAVADELRHRDDKTAEVASDEVARFLALHALSGAIPLLRHILEVSVVSPERAYLQLAQLAGQLSAFSVDEDPALLPSYSHADPRLTFVPLLAKLHTLLQATGAGRVVCVKLEPRLDGMHLGRLHTAELCAADVRFVLAVQSAVPEQAAHELLPRVAKMASWTEISSYLNAAVSTVSLVASARPPREVPLRAGKQYFVVDTSGPAWRGVVHERTIALHLPPPFTPATTNVELFAIPGA